MRLENAAIAHARRANPKLQVVFPGEVPEFVEDVEELPAPSEGKVVDAPPEKPVPPESPLVDSPEPSGAIPSEVPPTFIVSPAEFSIVRPPRPPLDPPSWGGASSV